MTEGQEQGQSDRRARPWTERGDREKDRDRNRDRGVWTGIGKGTRLDRNIGSRTESRDRERGTGSEGLGDRD